MTYTDIPHTAIGVVGVVHGEAGLLLTLSRDRGWEPPGGFVDRGESAVSALHREVLEETGWEVTPCRLTGIYHCVREVPIMSLVFDCTATREAGQAGEESLGTIWAAPAEIPALVRYPPHLLRIHDALADRGGVFIRAYRIAPFQITATTVC